MPQIKGTDVVALRNLVRERGASSEQSLLSQLSPALRQLYLETSPITWNSLDSQAELYEVASSFLFPKEPNSVARMHKMLAEVSYSSIYKIFMQIPTLAFIVKRAALVWRKYYDAGVAGAENQGKNSLDFVVREFPELPRALREATTGHLSAILEMTGAKNVVVTSPAETPAAWAWHISWRE